MNTVGRKLRPPRADDTLNPHAWLCHVGECAVCHKHVRARGCTPWMSGHTHPSRAGWYERLFIDGVFRQHWDGVAWRSRIGGIPHWRPVGHYPCWRGLTCTAFMSPSRYPMARVPTF